MLADRCSSGQHTLNEFHGVPSPAVDRALGTSVPSGTTPIYGFHYPPRSVIGFSHHCLASATNTYPMRGGVAIYVGSRRIKRHTKSWYMRQSLPAHLAPMILIRWRPRRVSMVHMPIIPFVNWSLEEWIIYNTWRGTIVYAFLQKSPEVSCLSS